MATNAIETTETSSTDLSKLSEKQMNEFMLTGELPEEPKESKPAESSTPAKTEGAASSPAKETVVAGAKKPEASAEPAPAATEPPKPEKGAESRVKELLADRKELLAKIAELEKRPAASPATAKKDEVPAKPQRTDLDEKGLPKYATDEAYEEARDEWVFKKASEETRKQIAKEQEDARITERQKLVADKWLNGMQLARTKYADLDAVLKTDEKGLVQHEEIKGIKAGSILDGWLVDSEVPFDLLYHFAKTPGEVAKIQAMTPFAATRYLTRLEDKFSSSAAPPAKAEEVPPAKAAEKRVPAPATNVSGKATAPTDEIARAVAAGDTAAYFAAANAEDLQKRKKG